MLKSASVSSKTYNQCDTKDTVATLIKVLLGAEL